MKDYIGHMYKKVNCALEIFECNLSYSKKFELYYRPDNCDLRMLKDGSGDYKSVNCKDKVLMDCGSNIGGFILKACKEGAKSVYAFEPEEFNFDVLNINTSILKEKYKTEIYIEKKALVPDDSSYMNFNIKGSKNSACSGSLMPLRGAGTIEVECTNFWKKVEDIKPDIIKMDIEGGEYLFIDRDFPEYVNEIVMELHGFKKEQNKLMFQYIDRIKNDDRFEVVSLEIVNVFNNPSLALLHYRRK